MRLIDADELIEHVWRDKLDSRELIAEMVDNVPPVKCVSLEKPNKCEDAISADVLNHWIGAEVLDRIRNEMHATAEKHEDGVYYLRDEWVDEIIDKYKAERSDKE